MNPITKIELYQTFKDNKPYLYLKSDLEKQLEQYNKEAVDLSSDALTLDSYVAEAFPDGGEWVFIEIKTEFTMEDDMLVQKKCLVKDPVTGRERHDQSLFHGALVEVAVLDWNLFRWEGDGEDRARRVYARNGDGLKKMRPTFYKDVTGLIEVHCYDGAENPDFLSFWSKRPDGSLRLAS